MQSLQETRLRRNNSHVGGDGLDDDRSDLILMLEKYAFDRLEIVTCYVQCQRSQCSGHSRAFGNSERSETRTGLRQETVRVSVITALEFDDKVPLRHSSRQPHSAHRCFRAAGDKTNLFNERNCPCNQRGKLKLQLGRHTKTCAAACLVSDCLADGGIRVSHDHRAPRTHKIEQLVSVRVVKVLPAAALDDQRLSTDGSERPDGTVHAANQHLLGALENLARTFAFAPHSGLRCSHVFSIKLARLQPACDILGMVGKNNFSSVSLDACQDVQDNSLCIQPATLL